MNNFTKKELDFALEFLSEEIDHLRSRMVKVQQEFGAVTKGKAVLLCDATFDYSPRLLRQTKQVAEKDGFLAIFKLYEQKVFGGHLPQSLVEIFQMFLGSQIPVVGWNLKTGKATDRTAKIGAVLLSGSPANVTFALHPQLKSLSAYEREEKTHEEVYKLASGFYRQAVEDNLPVLGVCYGHQVVSNECGSKVIRNPKARVGYFPVKPTTEYETAIIRAVTGSSKKLKPGYINASHSELVVPNKKRSAVFLKSHGDNNSVIQGMVHLSPFEKDEFTGNKLNDSALIENLFLAKKHLALTIQPHPEATEFIRLVNFYKDNSFAKLIRPYKNILAPDFLRIFLSFLRRYN